jgi:hypothetical protein
MTIARYNLTLLREKIDEASATTAEVQIYVRASKVKLEGEVLKKVQYAFARACYREERPLTLMQLCCLLDLSQTKTVHYLKRISRTARFNVVSHDDASKVMSMVAEY